MTTYPLPEVRGKAWGGRAWVGGPFWEVAGVQYFGPVALAATGVLWSSYPLP